MKESNRQFVGALGEGTGLSTGGERMQGHSNVQRSKAGEKRK